MPPDAPLTGPALGTSLLAAGLAPAGVHQVQGWTARQPTWLYVHGAESGLWQPWCCIADVWHLVLRYRLRIELDYCGQGTWIWHEQHYEQAADDSEIPAAAGRLALRLRAMELAQEATP